MGMSEGHDNLCSERQERTWYGFVWAVMGFGAGTGMMAPLILAIELRDRVIGGMIYGGIPLALVGLAYGLRRSGRLSNHPHAGQPTCSEEICDVENASGTRGGVTMIEMLVVLAIVVVLLGLLLPAVYYSREASRRMGCQGNLYQLSMAMSHLLNAKGRLPNPPVVGTMNGWAIEILPFLEETALSDGLSGLPQLDSPAALALAAMRPAIMRCPSGYDGDSDIPTVPASHYTARLDRDVKADRCGWTISDLPTDSRIAWVVSPEGGFGSDVSTWSMPHTGGYNQAGGGRRAHQGVWYVEGR